jgi:hypothetical protein
MKSKSALVLVAITGFALAFALIRWQRHDASVELKLPFKESAVAQKIPPLPSGVTELKFSEFFVSPVGPRGLELTDRLLSLNGKRVRMLGYMVRNERGLPGQFLFASMPVQLHDHDSSDDLPAALVHVSVPTGVNQQVPYAPGLMLLTGTLDLGPREEADGRNSLVRLAVDPPPVESGHLSAQRKVPPRLRSSAAPLTAQFHQH